MSLKSTLSEEIARIRPDQETLDLIGSMVKMFSAKLEEELAKNKINAEVFIGGSFAKGTLLKKKGYDVDIFVRFDWTYDQLAKFLGEALSGVCKDKQFSFERIHGSRDYFRVYVKGRDIYFEIIPVTKISKPSDERNVTDLSYFHVPYVRKKLTKKLADEVLLAKSFAHAQHVYGAESYIQGFSGYALECLIIYYKSFEKMLKELIKIDLEKPLVVDPAKHFKKKEQVFISLNESKLHSPIILIDPTYKERNALAALSKETLERFQKVAKEFLAKPSLTYFEEREIDVPAIQKLASKKGAEYVHIRLATEKQKGDIAGTKLKKFHYFLEEQLQRYFTLVHHEFEYTGEQEAEMYIVVKAKKEIVLRGPPTTMESSVKAFRNAHPKAFEKKGNWYATQTISFSAREFLHAFFEEHRKTLEQMSISSAKIS